MEPGRLFVAAAHELEQEREQVEEVEVELQRAHDGGALEHVALHGAVNVFALEPLGVPCSQSGKHEHAAHCFAEAQKLLADRVSFALGSGLSLQASQQGPEARFWLHSALRLAESK